MNPVEKLKQELRTKNLRGLALDIDETLARTFQTWAGEMLSLFGNPENLNATQISQKYRISKNVPYWQSHEAIAWKKAKIHDNEFQKDIPVIADALLMVPKIHKLVPIVAYITSRPETVLEGTQSWLVSNGFPLAPVITFPHPAPAISSDEWKASVLTELFPYVTGIVDDNPGFIHYLPGEYRGTIYLYTAPTALRNDIDFRPCPTWNDVYAAIKNRIAN